VKRERSGSRNELKERGSWEQIKGNETKRKGERERQGEMKSERKKKWIGTGTEGRKEGKKERRKEGRKEGRRKVSF
jgi:hypothetical protein